MIEVKIIDPIGGASEGPTPFDNLNITSIYENISSTFSVRLLDTKLVVRTGYWLNVIIDGTLRFQGYIDSVSKSFSSAGYTITLNGRDATALLIDAYCNVFKDYTFDSYSATLSGGIKIHTLIEELINQTSFLSNSKVIEETVDDEYDEDEIKVSDSENKAIQYDDFTGALRNVLKEEGVSQDYIDLYAGGTLASAREKKAKEYKANTVYKRVVKFSDEFEELPVIQAKIAIGNKVWAKIQEVLTNTKFEAAMFKENILYFGDLKKIRYEKTAYDIENLNIYSNTKNKNAAMPLSGSQQESISNRYNVIKIYNEQDVSYSTASAKSEKNKNIATIVDNTAGRSMMMVARSTSKKYIEEGIKLREDQRYLGLKLNYVFQGYLAPDGRPWEINRNCNVYDEIMRIIGIYVVNGVSLKYSRNGGTTTEVTLSNERLTARAI